MVFWLPGFIAKSKAILQVYYIDYTCITCMRWGKFTPICLFFYNPFKIILTGVRIELILLRNDMVYILHSFHQIFSLCFSIFRAYLSLKWKPKGFSDEFLGSVNLYASFVLSIGKLNLLVHTLVVLEMQLYFKVISSPCNIFFFLSLSLYLEDWVSVRLKRVALGNKNKLYVGSLQREASVAGEGC